MAAKLKSITKLIHWSLLARVLVFALAWLYLPFWIFLLLALYCYFVPAFHAGRLFILFFTLLVLCYVEPSNAGGGAGAIVMAIIFGAIFYYLLLKKDLLLIDRVAAHELLVLVLSFFLFREFFMAFAQGPTGAALVWAFLTALLWSRLLNNFMTRKFEDMLFQENYPLALRRTAAWLGCILMAQALIVVLFLPLNFIYQSTTVFLVAALLIELLPDHAAGILTNEKIRLTGTAVFALLVVVLTAAKW